MMFVLALSSSLEGSKNEKAVQSKRAEQACRASIDLMARSHIHVYILESAATGLSSALLAAP